MHVRPLIRDDLPVVSDLSRQLALHVADPDPGPDTGDLADALFGAAPCAAGLVAEIGDRVVGLAVFSERFEAHTRRRTLWLSDLVVLPDDRSRGVGAALIAALVERARERGCVAIDFEVWRHNERAAAFYATLGASILDDRDLFSLAVTPTPDRSRL